MIGLCFAAVAVAVLEAVSPQGNLRKPVRMLLTLFLLCALLIPAASLRELASELSAAWSGAEASEWADDPNASLAAAFRVSVQETVAERLLNAGIRPGKLSVSVSVDADTVSLDAVAVEVAESERARAADLLRAMGVPYKLTVRDAERGSA